MPLHWNVDRVKNWKELRDPTRRDTGGWQLVTAALPLAMQFVQLGAITEDNIDEFWRRLNLWQHGVTTFLYHGEDKKFADRFFTRAEVERHIGLTANIPAIPPKKWDAYFKQVLVDQVNERILTYQAQQEHENKFVEELLDATESPRSRHRRHKIT